MHLSIFLQRSECNGERYYYCKNKTKKYFHHNIPYLFPVNTIEWFILYSLSSFMLIKICMVVTTSVVYWIMKQCYDCIFYLFPIITI